MPHSIPVSKIMTPPRDWPLINGDFTVKEAVMFLRIVSEDAKLEHGHSIPLILGSEGKVIGFVRLTELVKALKHLCDGTLEPGCVGSDGEPVRDLAVEFAGEVGPDDSIMKALDIMISNNVSIVPVIVEGKLEGVIKLADAFGEVVAALFDEQISEDRDRLLRGGHFHW